MFKSQSKVTVKVTRWTFMLPLERPCHKEHICQIWKPYMNFPLTNVKWHSVTWPYTMTIPYWSDFVPNLTFYRFLGGFHRTYATGVACRQGTLTPSDTWSHPFGTWICSTRWDQSFSEPVVIFPDYALRISLGTFSILLLADLWPLDLKPIGVFLSLSSLSVWRIKFVC